MADDNATADARVRSHREIEGGVDSISTLPDEILQQILSLIPTEFAVRTSLLSKRWKHVWCNVPSFSVNGSNLAAASFNNTLTRYTAPKIINFQLRTFCPLHVSHITMWIQLAMSRNVENMSLCISFLSGYKFPDFFYINSSIKQLTLLDSYIIDMNPRCSMSWTSVKILSLHYCRLSDESMAMISSGCPVLESLTISYCYEIRVLDLTKSLRLRTLEIYYRIEFPGPTHIVAPHIYSLRLTIPCILVDVSSLKEAELHINFGTTIKADCLQDMVLEMLEKLQNVEKLTFGEIFLQVLSLAEVCGVTFPTLKVKTLILTTSIFQYVIPGIERVLQNSPDLKKLTLQTRTCDNNIPDEYLDKELSSRGLKPAQCWRSKDGVCWNKARWDVESKHVASFMELVFKNTKTSEKMVVQLEHYYLKFKELIKTLSHDSNVSIVLSTR